MGRLWEVHGGVQLRCDRERGEARSGMRSCGCDRVIVRGKLSLFRAGHRCSYGDSEYAGRTYW
eukprot:5789056-Prymnesium_polylepis.2